MRHSLTLAILLAGWVQTATATEPSRFEWTQEAFDRVAAGDSAAGEELAAKFRCAKCHNETGVSDDEDVPSIAGQRATYMYKQLMDFKQELCDDRDMIKNAKKLSEKEMIDISTWFAQQERPPMVGGEPLLVVKVCDSCHEKDVVEKDNRIEVAPVIAGQVRNYLQKTMLAFKQMDRSNDLFLRMQSVSHKLSDDEIRQLAAYYGAKDPE